MIALTQDCLKLAAVLAGELLEALLPAMETSEMVPSGTVTLVVDFVPSVPIMANTYPAPGSLVGSTVAVTLEAGIICPSGVTGVLATEP